MLRGGDGGKSFDGAGAAAGDRIDVSGIDANTSAAGNQAFAWGGTGIGRISAIEFGNTATLVRANTDGDAAFEFELVIEDAAGQGLGLHRGRLHPLRPPRSPGTRYVDTISDSRSGAPERDARLRSQSAGRQPRSQSRRRAQTSAQSARGPAARPTPPAPRLAA